MKTGATDHRTRTPAPFFFKMLKNSWFFQHFAWPRRRAQAALFYQPVIPPEHLSASSVWGIKIVRTSRQRVWPGDMPLTKKAFKEQIKRFPVQQQKYENSQTIYLFDI